MSIAHLNQIRSKIDALFADRIDSSDIGDDDQERQTKLITRCLAAYAIYNSMECSLDDAAKSVVDGPDDNGIDAIYYSHTLKQMTIVQSKWIKKGAGTPKSDDISKFCQGVRDIFRENFDRFNQHIRNMQNTIVHAIEEFGTKYLLILIDTGDKNLAIHGKRQIKDLLDELNSAGEESTSQLVRFDRMNQGKIFNSLALSAGNQPIDLEVGLSQWGKTSEPYLAFYGIVAGEEIAKWWCDNGRRLFDKNLRQVLGKTDVNDEIRSTIKNSPENFWYFNNGITIVASYIKKSMVGGNSKDIGSFRLSGVSVVNGAQTVSTIGSYSEEKGSAGLEKVRVQVKLISLSDAPEEFGSLVTRANNRQNRIENRDFVSQDPEQIRIKTELAIDGIEYNLVRSDSFKSSEKAFDLQEATAALACCSCQPNLAVQAKREIGKFWEDLSGGIYKSIFNANTTGAYIYNCVRIIRVIDRFLDDKITLLPKKSGRYYGLLVHGRRIIALVVARKLNVSQYSERIEDCIIDEESIASDADDVIRVVFDILERRYSDNYLSTLFKNASICRDIVDLVPLNH